MGQMGKGICGKKSLQRGERARGDAGRGSEKNGGGVLIAQIWDVGCLAAICKW